MPTQHNPVSDAADLARDVALDIAVILITHYPDVETLDTLRPGETDLETARAVNRAVATEMAQAGVEVLVQRADRAAFRRWMSGREDTPENRHAWIDRSRVLRGSAAMAVLGLATPPTPPAPAFGKAPGPIADYLLDAFNDADGDAFDGLVQALMEAGRVDVLDLAVRKRGERDGDQAGDELDWVLLVAAEGAAIGPSGWTDLIALPVALSASHLPDAEALGQSLIASGALASTAEIRFLPGWRSPAALQGLSFGAVRRVLLDMANGKPPRDLPPADTDDLTRLGFGVLIGLRIDWGIPVWDAIAAAGGLPEEPDDDDAETPDDARRATLFDHWRGTLFNESEGCVPLGLVAFSQAGNAIADFLAEAGDQTGGLEAIRDFVAASRAEAGGSAVLGRPRVIGDALELSLYTADGDFLDSLTLPAERLPLPAEEMPKLIAAFVRLAPE